MITKNDNNASCTLVPSVFVPLDQRSGNSVKAACAVRDEDSRYEIAQAES